MARQIRQILPKAPPAYDQEYIAQLAEAVNQYMVQATAPAEVTAARFLCVDPIAIPGDVPDTGGLPTGMLYLQAALAEAADTTVAQQSWATGSMALTTTSTAVPGTAVTVTRLGTYLFIATFDFTAANEQGAFLYGTITDAVHSVILDTSSKQGRTPVNQQAIVSITTVPQTIQLLVYKGGGTGNSSVGTESNLITLWIAGPPAAGANGTGGSFFTLVTPEDTL